MTIDESCVPILRVLITITASDASDKVTSYLQNQGVHLMYATRCEGTASSDILDYLGLGATSKAMTMCLVPRGFSNELLEDLSIRFKLMKAGKGIAYSLPLSGITQNLMKRFTPETREQIKTVIEKEVENMKGKLTHCLILSVINLGYSEELMQAAKAAGATGGTLIHARRVQGEDSVKLFGITLQEEKEIVMILAEKEKKMDIMKAIGKQCGIYSDAAGVVFALPVEGVAGLESGQSLNME